ncbi:MAG: isopentenyl phosphate kinase [Anaerolineae bacterium]
MLTFLKLGGSLITDKSREATFRADVMARLAGEIAAACAARPAMRLLIGHGSGSFGHFAAARHGTVEGVRSPEAWRGFAEVGTVAGRLNRLVTDALHAAGLPVISVQPSASGRCVDGRLVSMALEPIQAALAHGLIPLVYGDVCHDDVRGGTIASTEAIMFFLARHLHPARVLLAGLDAGVLTPEGAVVPRIDAATLPELDGVLGGRAGVDVTGGMRRKVLDMLDLAGALPGVEVRIFSGAVPGAVQRALAGEGFTEGTLIADS